MKSPLSGKRLPAFIADMGLAEVEDLDGEGGETQEASDDDDDDAEDDDDPSEAEEPTKKPAQKSRPQKSQGASWIFEWNSELSLPQRRKINAGGKQHGPIETALAPQVPDDADDDSLVVATFMDGTTAEIPSKTWGDLRELKKNAPKIEPLYEATHCLTKNKIRVDLRVDRALLLSVYESSKQIFNLCLWDYGELPTTPPQPARLPNDSPLVQKAFKAIKHVVIEYVENKIDIETFKAKINLARDKTRTRKTPLGLKTLAAFLREHGHPAPWAQGHDDPD